MDTLQPVVPLRRRSFRRGASGAGLLLVAMSGCDAARDVVAPPERASFNLTQIEVPQISGDATTLIRGLVADYDVLVFPEGTWRVTDTIPLDANTVIRGQGGTRSKIEYHRVEYGTNHQNGFDKSLFVTDHTDSNVTVEQMYFEGTASRHQFALKAYGSRDIHFRNNRLRKIGIFASAARENRQDFATESDLGGRYYIVGNTVQGREDKPDGSSDGVCGAVRSDGGGKVDCEGDFGNQAIEIGYARVGEVVGNHINNYSHGIVIWGGNAKIQPMRERLASDFRIEGNWVAGTYAGIMTSNAERVDVIRNTVKDCSDTCLDSEGSANVTFFDNTAMFASNYVISVFYRSGPGRTNFQWNRIRKGDKYTDEDGDLRDVSHKNLFRSVNGDPGSYPHVAIAMHNNEFVWEGTGTGVISREHAGSDATPGANWMLFSNNVLTNVVVDFRNREVDNGPLQMRSNRFHFTHAPTAPVIDVSGNHLAGSRAVAFEGSPWQAEISGNVITSVPKITDVPALRVWQNGGAAIGTLIEANQIRDFSTSIKIISDVDPGPGVLRRADHHFAVVNNGLSGGIDADETLAESRNIWGNYSLPNS